MPMRMPKSNTNARMNTIANTNPAARVNANRNMREVLFDWVNSGATVSGGSVFALH